MTDLIDRQAAITLPFTSKEDREYQTYNLDDAYELGWLDYQKCIEDLPSAERRGQWKPFDLTWGRSIYACTACGDAFEVPTECGKPMYEFCPYCGAKMDLEEDK